MKKKLISAFVLVSFFSGQTVMAQQEAPAPKKDKPCNSAAMIAGGAILGALLGGKKGAVIGGALGGIVCVTANYQAKKVKSAEEVTSAYQRENRGQLPEHATLVQYESTIQPDSTFQPGSRSSLSSYIEVAQGRDGIQPLVEEEIALYDPQGKQLKTVRKPASESPTAGAFQTDFSFSLPKGVPEGRYQFKTIVFLDGENVGERTIPLIVINA